MEAIEVPDEASIIRMFTNYVEGFDSRPRHSKAADIEVGAFDSYVSGACPGNLKLQDGLCRRMMNVAVEYEQCGFVAGVRYAFQLIRNQAGDAAEAMPGNAAPGEAAGRAVPGNDAAEWREPEAASWSITSKQIAEMFETSHYKVVLRIETRILPELDAQSRLNFRKEVGQTPQRKKYVYYRLNRAACDAYMKEMDLYKKYVKVAGGLAKMGELVQAVFPKEKQAPL